MGRSKFNVGDDLEKRSCDGIVFDSIMEMKYYRDVVLPQVESGSIIHYELQKSYELQPKFERGGRKFLPIIYVADFYIEYSNGETEIIDIKGAADSVAKIKRKMTLYRYPELKYRWITYVKKFGGWVDYDEVQKLRREAKKERVNKEDFDHEQNEEADV